MKMLFERIGRLLQELDERRYPQEVPVESWKMKQTRERFSPEKRGEEDDWQTLGAPYLWGGHRESYWFSTRVKQQIT